MMDFGLVAVTLFGLIVAVFIAAALVRKEVEKRTVFVLFSKPVSRAAFIAGKFVGLGAHAWPSSSRAWASSSSCSCGSSTGDATGLLLVAVALIYVQLLVVMAVDDLLLDAGARRSSPACWASACSSPGS